MRVLHLEDCESDAELIRHALCLEIVNCQVTRVDSRMAFTDSLDKHEWDIVIADYSLPSFDGISALRLVAQSRPDLPFIFVTGALGEDLAIQTLKSGATDYIPKHRLDRLPQAVVRAARESELASARREAEQKLKDSLREKELLLQEVHHRVNNNFQVISSLLGLQLGMASEPLLVSAFQECQRRIRSMAMIHQMFYSSSSLKDIDFAEYSRLLANEVSDCCGLDPGRIRLAFDLQPLRLELDRAIPCGLILNELLTNAFKYAFPKERSGEIRISLEQREGCIQLAVGDNGVGLPVEPSERTSLGLLIVRTLTKQLRGNMEITSGQGARFVLTMPSQPARSRS